jgi:hypothetical protein
MPKSPSDQWDVTTFLGLVALPYAAGADRARYVRVRSWLPRGLIATVRYASLAGSGGLDPERQLPA